MKRWMSAVLAAGVACSVMSVAQARDGCGQGLHRGFYGHCRPNGPGYGGPGPGGLVLVIGNHYPGRGYWDGRRYWERRERWHGGWHYRH